jgi:DNA polymerase
MDRNEAVLRELNLYPLWQRRNAPVQTGAMTTVGAIHESPKQTGAMTTERAIDETTSHSTRLSKDDNQVAGYRESPLRDIDWPELKKKVHDCTACGLRAGCTQTVFGTGDEKAEWLFVGEGPGADEDALGEPFVGQAGQLLNNMLLAIKLQRGKNVYITNIVKCRPHGNRTPTAEEIAQCLPYLQRQIALIQPKLIVALGKTAATALLQIGATEKHPPIPTSDGLEHDTALANLRGTLHDYQGIPLIVTYHPAYLLRCPSEKAKAWQDLCLATGVIHEYPR